MKKKFNFDKFKNILAPQEEIGAIEINNRVVRAFYFSVNNNLEIKASAMLPVEKSTINNGCVENEASLIKTLTELKKVLCQNKKVSPYIILSLPAQNFYTSILSIPKLSDENSFKEAVKLNLRLKSPISLENSYLDWEDINEDNRNNKIIFTAVGDKYNIDKYLNCLNKAGFKVIAVEKPALGILRFLKKFNAGCEEYLVVNIDRDGVDLVVSQNNHLVFYDFSSLSEIAKYDLDSNLSTKDFVIFLNKKVGQIINFYQAHQKSYLKKFFLFSIIPNIKNELIHSLGSNLSLEPLSLKDEKIIKIPEEWYSVIGSAIRGTIPRGEDKIVSLMQTGTEKDYTQNQALNLISMWTKISITVFASLLLIFYSILNVFFKPLETSLVQKNKIINNNQEILKNKISNLEKQVGVFNSDIVRFLAIANKKTNWETKMDFVFDLAKKNQIEILKMFVSNESKNVTLQGSSPSQLRINNFKDDIQNTNNFSNITAPLESISSDGDNYYFSIKLTLN
jgi:Tfp pilus assembly PilM family ATPase